MSKLAIWMLAAACCLCLLAPARAEMTGIEKLRAAKNQFRVCADPDNLPFSNRNGEGFENKVAERLAQAAGQPLVYDWWPARRGFIKNTLDAWDCDVVIGVPSGYELAATTDSYYCSRYVMAYRDGERLPAAVLDAAAARSLRIGVIERTPPLDIAIRHHVDPAVYFTDYGYEQNFPGQIFRDLAEGKIDVALVWGPVGGYFARHSGAALEIAPLTDDSDRDIRLTFPISMGVRHGDKERVAWLNTLLQRNAQVIDAILNSYGVPLAHDPKGCSPASKEAAGDAPPSVRLAAERSAQPTQQGNAPPPQQSGTSSQQAKQPPGGGTSQTAPCDPNETIDQVKSELPSQGGQQDAGSGGTQHPYVAQDNKLGPKTYEGWVRFSAFCERCHGPGGIGSALAPDLAAAVKSLTKPQFEHIVRCGVTGTIGIGVMPPWGDNPNISPYIDDLWSYLQARADGAIGPGRPDKLTSASKQ